MKRKFSAGGIISKIHEGNTFILCLTTKNNLLTLPKGHLEKGETPEQAAIREIKEEIGLRSASITKKLGEIVRVGTEQDGSQSIKKITYFIMDGSEYTYDHEENYVWVGFDMALKLMDHPEEKNLLFDNEESIAKNTSAYFNSYKSFINYYYYPKKTILSENYELLNKVRKFVNSNTVAVVIGIPTKQEKELFSKTHKTLYVSPGIDKKERFKKNKKPIANLLSPHTVKNLVDADLPEDISICYACQSINLSNTKTFFLINQLVKKMRPEAKFFIEGIGEDDLMIHGGVKIGPNLINLGGYIIRMWNKSNTINYFVRKLGLNIISYDSIKVDKKGERCEVHQIILERPDKTIF